MCETKRNSRFHQRDVLQVGAPVRVIGCYVANGRDFDACHIGGVKAKHGVFGVFACAGMILVGAAPNFKEETKGKVHTAGGVSFASLARKSGLPAT